MNLLKEGKVIPGTFDPVFKEIFTSPDCHNFVCTLISQITKMDLEYLKKNLKVINTNIPKERAYEKTTEADILLSVEGNILNLEMNKDYYEGLFEKNDVYQHALISRILKRGESYLNLKKVIQINIDNFSKFKKEISVFKLLEIDTHEIENENYIKYHIALPKILKKYYNKTELSYLEKLLLMIVIDEKDELKKVSKGDKVLMELRKKIETLSEEELFANMYDKEWQEKMVYNTKMEYAEKTGLEKGMKQGLEQGLEQGRKEGKEKEKIDIAKKMLKDGLDIETISKYTGLKKEQIENIK